jgi:hypothetical protein
MELNELIRHICDVFNRHSVDYLIVGGIAVGLHGYPRNSVTSDGKVTEKPDLDFWYRPTHENYYKLLNAIEELGKDMSRYRNETYTDVSKSFFKLEFDAYTLDLLPQIKSPLKFQQSFAKREVFPNEGVEISLICLEDLIQDKSINARPKDMDDIEHLRGNE